MNGYEQIPGVKSVDDQMQEDFSLFLDRENCTQHDVTRAYLALFENDHEEANELSEKEEKILSKMREMESQKFPVSRFATMITLSISSEKASEMNTSDLSLDDEMINEFTETFILSGDYTSQEMKTAYLKLIGVNEGTLSEKEQVLLAKMYEMEEKKLPINKFAEMAEAKERLERMPQEYESFIDTLDISGREAQVLKSIVQENRSGMLTLTSGDMPEDEINIHIHEDNNSEPNQEVKAMELVRVLKAIMTDIPKREELEIAFEEE